MKLRDIEIPITNIAGVGQSIAKCFSNVNVFTVADLFSYYPRDWEDRTKTFPLASFAKHAKVHTLAEVIGHEWFGFGRMKTLKIIIQDKSATGSLICFNRPFFEKTLPLGSIISVTGSFSIRKNELQCSSFDAVCISKSGSIEDYEHKPLPDSAVIPIYPLTQGLGQKQVRKAMSQALKEYTLGIEDELPEYMVKKYNLFSKIEAINAIHNPKNIQDALKAKQTLIFEELYNFQKNIIARVADRKKNATLVPAFNTIKHKNLSSLEIAYQTLSPAQKQLWERLHFHLTEDQAKVITQINAEIDAGFMPSKNDQEVPFQMSRLLQGDVGSGKTLVAFFACLRVVDWGAQCAILAPTEILAKQHAESAAKLLEPIMTTTGTGVKVAFLTGNVQAKGRKSLLKALKENSIDIIIGTHALFSKNVIYKNLRFVVVDEQHRFGVIQRNAIIDKGRTSLDVENKSIKSSPAVLMMSATPIPQTLALTVYGDLDVSTISTMPIGRKPIITHLTRQGNESRAYEAIRLELQKGRQAYFVYPRIEEEESIDSDDFEEQNEEPFANKENKSSLKSAEQMYAFLSTQVYPEYTCAVIHSKVDDQEQSRILAGFKNNEIQILVATSVVEVGVDIPNATCMAIEHAERFGLAALHQLRGRVGRGTEQSSCFLIYSNKLSELGKARLKVMHESTDGFFIAEEDLRLRGPGEVSGIQQSGYLTLGISDPARDIEILQIVRKELLTEMSVSPE